MQPRWHAVTCGQLLEALLVQVALEWLHFSVRSHAQQQRIRHDESSELDVADIGLDSRVALLVLRELAVTGKSFRALGTLEGQFYGVHQ